MTFETLVESSNRIGYQAYNSRELSVYVADLEGPFRSAKAGRNQGDGCRAIPKEASQGWKVSFLYCAVSIDAQNHIECECFELRDYESFNELEIESVKVESIDDSITPLKITRNSLLLSTTIKVKVSGYAEVFDEDNSIGDSEDREYFYMAYADVTFTDAEMEVECEILISFDFDDPEDSTQVVSFKLLNQGHICIDCRDATVCEITEDEMALRALREDKGYPRRIKKE